MLDGECPYYSDSRPCEAYDTDCYLCVEDFMERKREKMEKEYLVK